MLPVVNFSSLGSVAEFSLVFPVWARGISHLSPHCLLLLCLV